jgi:hypothetical protein
MRAAFLLVMVIVLFEAAKSHVVLAVAPEFFVRERVDGWFKTRESRFAHRVAEGIYGMAIGALAWEAARMLWTELF